MSETLSQTVSLPGCIDDKVYRSLQKYLLPPYMKIILLALFIGYEFSMIVTTVSTQNWANIIWMVLFGGLLIFLYFHNQKSSIKRILKAHPELTNGGFDVTLSFGAENVKLFNHTTGSERTLAYSLIRSMVDTDACIACFTKRNDFLMIPKNRMSDDMRGEILKLLHEKCPKLKKRW